jgi:hypothetical protein
MEMASILTPFGWMKVPIPTGRTQRYVGNQFAEAKAVDGTLYNSSNNGQLEAMIGAIDNDSAISQYGGTFILGTTSETIISDNLDITASYNKITILHLSASYRMSSDGSMQVTFLRHSFFEKTFYATIR